jgi:hypothetical protein
MATMCGVEHGVLPWVRGQRLQTAQDRRATPPEGDEPEAALVQLRQFPIGCTPFDTSRASIPQQAWNPSRATRDQCL